MAEPASIPQLERKDRLQKIIQIADIVTKGRDSEYYYWLQNLSLTLKGSATTPMCLTLAHRVGGRGQKSAYINSFPQILALLRAAMLNFRYSEALILLKVILQNSHIQVPIVVETALYRCGMEILYNTPESTHLILPHFVTQLKQLVTVLNTPQIIVEKSTHYLAQNNIEEAKEHIEFILHQKYHSLITSHYSTKYSGNLQKLYSAYISYLDWHRLSEESDNESQMYDVSYSQNLRMLTTKHRDDALVKFEVLESEDFDGVWDIFIKPYITLLLSKGEKKDALEFLIGYKSRRHHLYPEFEPSKNPNSYIFLIDFLTDHPDVTPPNLLKETYEEYMRLVPSDRKIALRYLSLISDQPYTAIETLMNLLDFPSNSGELKLWEQLDSLLKEHNDQTKLTVLWADRKTWWSAFHTNFCRDSQLHSVIHKVLKRLQSL